MSTVSTKYVFADLHGYSDLKFPVRRLILSVLHWYESAYRTLKDKNDYVHRYAEHMLLEVDAGKRAKRLLSKIKRDKLTDVGDLVTVLEWLVRLGEGLDRQRQHEGFYHSEAENEMETDGGERLQALIEALQNINYGGYR